MERNHQRGPVIGTLGPRATRLAHTKGDAEHIRAFNRQGVTTVQRRLEAFRQLREIRALW